MPVSPGPRNVRHAELERTVFEFSRSAEYFDLKELQAMTGQPASRLPGVLMKEVLDNALDASEQAKVAPRLDVRVSFGGRRVRLSVRDNGGGIAPETVRSIIDLRTRTSDKAAYRSPTRGAMGNAFKTVIGIPYALGCRAPVVVQARSRRHVIRVSRNLAGEAAVGLEEKEGRARRGTAVSLRLPRRACAGLHPLLWARRFALFNPHASVRIRVSGLRRKRGNSPPVEIRKTYRPTVAFPDGWRKFLPTDLTSPWWYDDEALGRLVGLHNASAKSGGKDLTLRDFVRQFRGLSGTAKAKAVCGGFPGVQRLSDLEARPEVIPVLLEAMRRQCRPPDHGVLGAVGEGHLRACIDRWHGVNRWWYKSVKGEADGVPFVVEAAVAVVRRGRGRLHHGVNFSPAFDDPFAGSVLAGPEFSTYGASGFLSRAHADPGDRERKAATVAVVHLICPALQFLDKGKTRLGDPPLAMTAAVARALWAVSRKLWGEEERRRKDAARQKRADRESERQQRVAELSLKAAVFRTLPGSVEKASGGAFQVSAHTVYYVVRSDIQPLTSRELSSDYFEQTLLPDYQREHGKILLPDGREAIYYEPRGTLIEPHTGRELPLGTREVRAYQFPPWVYDKILFVEKQGLWPTLKAARLAEQYDMAIVAGEGFATEACRDLLATADKGRSYQVFVLHDADPYGYNIARTLRGETRRMPRHDIQVTDVGLRLGEALELGLATEYFTRRKALPQGIELTGPEREYFTGEQQTFGRRPTFLARRVELNAFTAPRLVAFIERKLEAAGVRGKVVPPAAVLAEQLRGMIYARVHEAEVARALAEANIDLRVAEAYARLEPEIRRRLRGLGGAVRRVLARDREYPWRVPLELVASKIVASGG
jgi:DNA topoisomerase VI subunit B